MAVGVLGRPKSVHTRVHTLPTMFICPPKIPDHTYVCCRDEALTAHQMAARKIIEQNNQGRPLAELDLHGLHASEATAALDAHITSVLPPPLD